MYTRVHISVFSRLLLICAVLLLIFFLISLKFKIDFYQVLTGIVVLLFIIFPVLHFLSTDPCSRFRKLLTQEIFLR